MRTVQSSSGDRKVRTPTLLGPVVLAVALLGTAVLSVRAATPVTATRAANQAATTLGVSATVVPGWHVVSRIGPVRGSVSGLLAADSASDAWSVWSGGKRTLVEHWTGHEWNAVGLPAPMVAYARAAVAIGASSSSNVWLFNTHAGHLALRWNGTAWALVKIPGWALRRDHSGVLTATAAVLGPRNVWLFSLSAGAYAAHYTGHGWVRASLPGTPTGVSAVTASDIWLMGGACNAWRWTGNEWVAVPQPPVLPLPFPDTIAYTNLAASAPDNAWLLATIYAKGSPARAMTAKLTGRSAAWVNGGGPADITGSVVPDGSGGLWADSINQNPGGFWSLYHASPAGKWSADIIPPGADPHQPLTLTRIPGTRSVWATGAAVTAKGEYGVILKFGP